VVLSLPVLAGLPAAAESIPHRLVAVALCSRLVHGWRKHLLIELGAHTIDDFVVEVLVGFAALRTARAACLAGQPAARLTARSSRALTCARPPLSPPKGVPLGLVRRHAFIFGVEPAVLGKDVEPTDWFGGLQLQLGCHAVARAQAMP